MKLSDDMTVKLAIAAGLGLAGFFLVRKIAGAAGAGVQQAAIFLNPADPGNLVNRGVTAVGSALVTDPEGPGKNADGSWTLGGYFYDIFHPTEVAAVKNISKPVNVSNTAVTSRQTYADTVASNSAGWDNTPGIY